MMVKEAQMGQEWLEDSLVTINRYALILWYERRAPMFDFADLEGMCGDAAYRNWEENVKEFKYKVRFAWQKGQVDEIHKLECIGLHNHAEFLRCLNDMAASGDAKKTSDMAFRRSYKRKWSKFLWLHKRTR